MKAFFILLYILFLVIPGYTLFGNAGGLEQLTDQGASSTTYTFLRLTGLFAFILIFIQIMLGAFMNYWRTVFGPKILNFHMREGIVAYGLILAHPAFFLLNALLANIPNPLGLLVPRFSTAYETYLSFGKIGFILLTIAIFAARFRNVGFLQRHWRKFHILNYIAFWLIFVHSFNLGSDTHTTPFSLLYPVMAVLVVISIGYRRIYIPFLKPKPSTPPKKSLSTPQS